MFFARTTSLLIALLITFAASTAFADATHFTLGTHEARTNISFVGEADIETIHGFTNQLAGVVSFDGDALSGEAALAVDVTTMDTGIPLRDEHLQGEMWLDIAKHPKIEVTITSLTKRTKKVWDITGTITVKGVSKPFSSEAKVKFVDAENAKRFKLGNGEWVNIKTAFEVTLTDHGVAIPEGVAAKVSDTWSISVDSWGTTKP